MAGEVVLFSLSCHSRRHGYWGAYDDRAAPGGFLHETLPYEASQPGPNTRTNASTPDSIYATTTRQERVLPHCHQTSTLTQATPAQLAAAVAKARAQQKKLPTWLKWVAGVIVSSLVGTVGEVALVNWNPTLGISALWQVYGWYMLAFTFIGFCVVGLTAAFGLYVSISLAEIRALLHDIAASGGAPTSQPKQQEPTGPSAGPIPQDHWSPHQRNKSTCQSETTRNR